MTEEKDTNHVSQTVTPWVVEAEGGVDYEKLVKDFGSALITPDILKRMEKILGQKPHRFLRRGLFFSHRDLELILEDVEKGKPIYLYTGRGPSSLALHLGHLIPFMFTKWLQDVFDAPLVVQLTDDEKFLFKDDLTLEESRKMAFENTRDIIAMGFNPDKTFIFSDVDYIQYLYPVALKVQKKVTYSQSRSIFGFVESDNIGKAAFPAIQAAPSFPATFPTIFKGRENVRCLIPSAIDQDPYFRMTRDCAPRLKWMKPSLIQSKFIPALQGFNLKMSGSVETTSICVTDDPVTIKNKINKYAFSGGRDTAEEQRKFGADLTVDIPYHYLTYFVEDDDELEKIRQDYSSGKMLTGEIKKKLIEIVEDIVAKHQAARAKVTDDVVRHFMDPHRESFKSLYVNK